jgi:hypothetical protein
VPFPSDIREKLLLWCDRHCCLGKKACDISIEVHHIVPEAAGGSDDEDNAMPLCFDCHSKVSHYDNSQPLGTKFKPQELKRRRDQVFDEFTRYLVPALHYEIQREGRELPDVGFIVLHPGNAPPVQLIVKLDTYINGTLLNRSDCDPLYRGQMRWNLNPASRVDGHFAIVDDATRKDADVRIGIDLTIYDVYDRPHKRLPVMSVYNQSAKLWWFDPVDPAEIRARIASTG